MHDLDATRAQPGRQHRRHPVARARRSGAARPDRGRPRSRRRRRPAGPAPCRCCWWPSPGGCAARGSAAPAAAPGCRRRRRDSRRAGRAAAGRGLRAPPGSPACGPPKPIGTPKRWVEPTTTSAPSSPGGVSSVSASRSAATATRPPRACASSISGRRVAHHARTRPGTTAAARTARRRAGRPARSATTSSMPSGSARVRSTVEGLRQRVGVDDEPGVARLPGPAQQRHRLGRGRRLVEQRGVGDGQAGEVGDHRLEVQQRLQPALADLGLVGRVGGVPGRVLEHVAPDHRRGDRAAGSPARSSGRSTVLRPASARSSASASVSVAAAAGPRRPRRPGRGSPRAAPASASSSSEVTPTAASMVASSSGRGPMCRSTNGTPCSRSCSDGRGASECSERLTVGLSGRGSLGWSDQSWSEPHAGRNRPPPLSSPGDRAPERFTGPDLRRHWPGFPRRRTSAPLPSSLSRGVSPARSWGLRDSGEELLLRRPARVRTLPRGVVDRSPS